MEFGLTEFQQMIKNSSNEFLSQECDMSFVKEMETSKDGYTQEFWKQIVSQGWTGISLPEEYGGTGGSFLDLAVLIENMGRYLAPGPLLSTLVLGGLTVLEGGTEEQKQELLPLITNGELIITLGLSEESCDYSFDHIKTIATREGSSYLITGTKLFVPYGHMADLIIVPAVTEELNVKLFLVNTKASGVEISPMLMMSADRQTEIQLTNVEVGSDKILGEKNDSLTVLNNAFIRIIIAKCLEMTGSLTATLDITLEYVKQRSQFGRSIGSFQAIQHHCSNIAIDLEGCRHVSYQAAWALSEGMDSKKYAHMAKSWLNEASQRICMLTHQSHGAIGFTKDYDLQMHTRWLKSQELLYGNEDYHKEQYIIIT